MAGVRIENLGLGIILQYNHECIKYTLYEFNLI